MFIKENLNNNKTELTVIFYHFKNTEIFKKTILLNDAIDLKIEKIKACEEFVSTQDNHLKTFTLKEVLKAYSLVCPLVKEHYKTLYPKGGWHNGGRPTGTTKGKGRTERFTRGITLEEKEYLEKMLIEYRKRNNKTN